MESVPGLAAIAARYDAFLIDQFGALHDGRKLYPGALDVLERLHALGKPVVIFTNSGKRNAANRQRVIAMGVRPELFRQVLSSGEVAWTAIRGAEFGKIGVAFIVGKSGEDYGFDGLELTFAEDAERSELILILGSNAPATSLEDYRSMLRSAASRRIPAICCNPDRQMLTPSGLQPAPGAIAELYEEMGGEVTWIGKPFPQIYRIALKLLGEPQGNRTLAIGDSIAHDVKGGRGAGLATALVRTGVSAGLGDDALRAAMREEAVEPDWMLPELKW